ncbi:Putative secreted protein [Klebsiella pneumoniae IS43]|uniref:Secreted protein n=1 Tax=Klebsiella pneumoniae IS43 TaxID=1432552 RepID=W1DEV2_KLEPN|nr:Putative secreted protein [Klebsiella pneumoniae IS43]
MKRTLFAVMALLASGAALADECSSANTQTEMNQCAAAQYQAADKKTERHMAAGPAAGGG